MDESSLSHTRWKCQYHIILVPKFRRKVVYGKLRKDIGEILRRLCDYKHVEIIEAHAMPDHIHMLLSIPPSICVSEFMGYLKGKSTLMIFERHAQLKYKYGRRTFIFQLNVLLIYFLEYPSTFFCVLQSQLSILCCIFFRLIIACNFTSRKTLLLLFFLLENYIINQQTFQHNLFISVENVMQKST